MNRYRPYPSRIGKSNLNNIAFLSGMIFLTIGCAAEIVQPGMESEEMIIEEYLTEEGYDVDGLQFTEDEVIVEGDMAINRDMLLNAALGMTDKAYVMRCRDLWGKGNAKCQDGRAQDNWVVSFGLVKNIKIKYSNVGTQWKTAFNNAAKAWSSDVKSKINISTGNTGEVLTISKEGLLNKNGTKDTKTIAVANLPRLKNSKVYPGKYIKINTNYQGGNAGLCKNKPGNFHKDVKMYNALHELGHVIGFRHPHDEKDFNKVNPDGLFLKGTSKWTGSFAYPTIMKQGCYKETVLSADDKEAVRLSYRN